MLLLRRVEASGEDVKSQITGDAFETYKLQYSNHFSGSYALGSAINPQLVSLKAFRGNSLNGLKTALIAMTVGSP